MSHQEKKNCNGKTKKEFASLIRRFPLPDSHILQLPADPSEFRNRFPGMYATMYPQATHSPVPCKIDRTTLLHLDSSYKCRGVPAAANPPDAAEAVVGNLFRQILQREGLLQQPQLTDGLPPGNGEPTPPGDELANSTGDTLANPTSDTLANPTGDTLANSTGELCMAPPVP